VIKGVRSRNASSKGLPDLFFDAESKNDARFGPGTSPSRPHPLLWHIKGYFCRYLLFWFFFSAILSGQKWVFFAIFLRKNETQLPEHF
jgi:hypothetical protein